MIEISTERARMDAAVIHRYLAAESYWARSIPLEIVERAIEGSVCVGAFDGGDQIGFARAVTDRATFAYVADVFVLPSHRGRGIARGMMEALFSHPDLQGLRRWHLVTRDAHALYAQFGFTPLDAPERHMQRVVKNAYE